MNQLSERTEAPPEPGLSLAEYDYNLPEGLIAQRRLPAGERSRLMVVDRAARTLHTGSMDELPSYLRQGDVLVRNDTRVLPARLRGVRTRASGGGPVPPTALEMDILLCHSLGGGLWEALVRPAKRVKPGDRIEFIDGTVATVASTSPDGIRRFQFESDEAAFACMEREGMMPLPPYVRCRVDNPADYQTSYATVPGAVAAPTAGFHFTLADFEKMQARGVEIVDLTLHVGPGTFQPIRVPDLRDHVMHRERYEIRRQARESIERARASGRRIVALGTTTVRVLESLQAIPAGSDAGGWTDIFIRPGHDFRRVDAMITNFHLPRTSLLVLVSAFGGRQLIREAYALAIARQFRFYSFGDGMLIL